jgi:hypothetical protein
MDISRADAATALREVDETQIRTLQARGYRHASPHLIWWGLIWAIGYASCGVLSAEQWGPLWLGFDLVGMAGSVVIGVRSASQPGFTAGGTPWKILLAAVFVGLFVVATYRLFAPTTVEPFIAFPAILIGLIYVLVGIWTMPRLAWVGVTIFLLAMIGFLFFKPVLPFWIAAVGGLGLILGGLWMRRA